jgi:hypothetical protein
MEMIVWRYLAAVHAVILKCEDSERLIGRQQSMRHFARGLDHSRPLLVRQIQQGSDMAAGYDTALADLELHWSNDRNRELRLREYRNCASTRQRLTDFTWILSWQFDHTALLSRQRQALLPEERQFVEITPLEDNLVVDDLKEAAPAQSLWITPL